MAGSSDPGGGGQAQGVLPDLLKPGMVTVLCGSAASLRSATEKNYYAHPANRFWRVLFEVGLTPRKFAPGEYSELASLRIGLTDLNKTEFGSDEEISPARDDPDGLHRRIEACRPRILAFTAKRPAKVFLKAKFGAAAVEYGPQPAYRLGGTELFVLPSTSGLNRRWDRKPWYELAERHRKLLAE